MAATLVSSKLHELSDDVSVAGKRLRAVYYVSVSEPTTPRQVRDLARQASGTNDPLPVYGAHFVPTLDSQPEDLTLLATNFVTQQRERGPDKRLKWNVTVTYEPQSASGQQSQQLDIDPGERDARFWTEQLIIRKPRDIAANLVDIKWPWLGADGEPDSRPAETLGPITNAAGIPIQTSETVSVRLPVFVMKSYSFDPFAWIAVQDEFGWTEEFNARVNKKEEDRDDGKWNIFGTDQFASEGTCMFLGIDTSGPLYWGNKIYFELMTRVLYNKDGHDIYVPNVGTEYWKEIPEAERVDPLPPATVPSKFGFSSSFASGLPIKSSILLDNNGGILLGPADSDTRTIRYRDTEAKVFSKLTSMIGGL